jgi:hypothetical protein
MVLGGPIDNLEFDLFLPEVCRVPKMTSKCITPKGYVEFPGTMPWKEVSDGKRSAIRILIFCSVSA